MRLAFPLSPAARISAALLFLACPTGFVTTVAAASDAGGVLLEHVVVTASPIPTALGELPSSVSILDQQDIQAIGHRHIAEALERVPGANISRGSGQEYLPALRSPVLSGAGACGSVLATENSIPLRAAGFCNVNELFEAHSEAARAIELVRGPAQLAFGSNAVHGVVNILPADLASPNAVSIEGGAEDFYRARIGLGDARSWRGDVTVAQDRGFRDSSGYDLQKASVYHQASGGNQQQRGEYWLSASHLDQDTAAFLEGTDAYKSQDLSEQNASPDAYRKAASVRAAARYEWPAPALGKGRNATLVARPYLRHAEMDFLMHFLPGEPVETNRQSSAGLVGDYRVDMRGEVQLHCGTRTEITDAALRQVQARPTQGSAFLVATIPQGKHYDYEVTAFQGSLHCAALWQPANTWSLQTGLRYEHMLYDYNNRMLDGRSDENGVPCGFGGCRYSRPADRRDHFNNWSPFIGVTGRLAAQHQWFANLSHGFRAPQATELYRLQREQQTADLDSEEMQGFETGLRGDTGLWRYELVAFAYTKRNVIFRDSDFFNVSGGKTRHRGVELSLDLALSENLSYGLRASYASHRYAGQQFSNGIDINGKMVDTAPRHLGTAFMRWAPVQRGWLELQAVHMSRYYTDPENAHRYAGHDYLNLRGGWSRGRWQWIARAINITDVRYAERADYTQFSGDRYFPGRPRTLLGEVRYSLD